MQPIKLKPNTKGPAILIMILAIFTLVETIALSLFAQSIELVVFLALSSVVLLFFLRHYILLSYLTIIVDEHCITAMNEKTKEAQFLSWEEVNTVYKVSGTKLATCYLLFSTKELQTKAQVKQVINKCSGLENGNLILAFDKNICFCTGFIPSSFEKQVEQIAKAKNIKVKKVDWIFKEIY